MDLECVKATVQTEMKSYSSALKETCAQALAPNKMQAAIKKAANEEDRSKNLMIFGLPEVNDEDLNSRVSEVLQHLNEKPRIVSCCRVGKGTTKGVKPVKFTLSASDSVRQILGKTKLLKEVEGFRAIYICPDRSPDDRLAYKRLTDELKMRRNKEPFRVHVIRNFKVVTFDKD